MPSSPPPSPKHSRRRTLTEPDDVLVFLKLNAIGANT
jgi:hypothetical protein